MPRPRIKPKPCQFCKKDFIGTKKTNFCSIPCFHNWKKNKIVSDIDPKIIEMYNNNISIPTIAKLFDIPETTIYTRFKLAGIDMQKTYKGKFNKKWRGVGRLNSAQLSKLKKPTNKTHHIVDITLEDMWDLFLAQNGKCALTGIELILPYDENHNPVSTKLITASLDRIDSNKGYIKGNIQWIHKYINIMKNCLNQEDFIILCNMVSRLHFSDKSIKDICPDFRIKS